MAINYVVDGLLRSKGLLCFRISKRPVIKVLSYDNEREVKGSEQGTSLTCCEVRNKG